MELPKQKKVPESNQAPITFIFPYSAIPIISIALQYIHFSYIHLTIMHKTIRLAKSRVMTSILFKTH